MEIKQHFNNNTVLYLFIINCPLIDLVKCYVAMNGIKDHRAIAKNTYSRANSKMKIKVLVTQ